MLRGHRLQKFSRVVDDEPAGQPLDLRLEFRQLAPVELDVGVPAERVHADRKSTRLNSSHITSSYAVFCLKKKKHEGRNTEWRAAHRASQRDGGSTGLCRSALRVTTGLRAELHRHLHVHVQAERAVPEGWI